MALAAGESAYCARCGSLLYRDKPHGVERSLALTVTALLLLLVSNGALFMTFEFEGQSQGNHIVTGVVELSRDGYWPLGGLILFASVLAPLLHLGGMLCVLVPIHLGRPRRWIAPLFRRLEALRPWSMLEVYLLGIFVAVIKLGQLATIEIDVAFWTYLALFVVASASYDALDDRQVWDALPLRAAGETG